MSDKVDEANHDAKQDANGPKGIDGAKDDIDALKPPSGLTNDKQKEAEKAKETVEDDLDAAIEDINAGRIRSADKHMRAAKKKLREYWPAPTGGNPDPLDGIVKKLDHARHKKALVTQPATANVAFDLREVVLALLADAIAEAFREGALVLPPATPVRNGEPSEPAKRRARTAARG